MVRVCRMENGAGLEWPNDAACTGGLAGGIAHNFDSSEASSPEARWRDQPARRFRRFFLA
jgi:hypothetical protein